MSVASFVERLRDGSLTDAEFDGLYPRRIRELSAECWTPLAVIRKAVALLQPATEVLDVGSGVGKFCIAGALLAEGTRFHGVERRDSLIRIARHTAKMVWLESRVYRPKFRMPIFHCGTLDELDVCCDGYYFYNPFGYGAQDRPGWTEADARCDFLKAVGQTEALLRKTAQRTRVVTYNGFGGEMPEGFYRESIELLGDDRLELWIHDPNMPLDRRPTAMPPATMAAEARARLCTMRYAHLPVTRQGRIGVALGLVTEEEYYTLSRRRIDECVFTRAVERGKMLDLERMIYDHTVPSKAVR